MKFKNNATGEILEATPLEMRLGRLQKGLKLFSGWADEIDEHWQVEKIMVTLTYRKVEDWKPRHVTEFIQKVRRYLDARLLGYFWVAEMQERGAVHYHVVLVVRAGSRIPKPDAEGYWNHGMTRVERVQKIYAYLAKYMQKDEQKAGYPKGIRIFGNSIYVMKEGLKRFKCPSWVYERINSLLGTIEDKVQRIALLLLEGLRKVKGGYECAGHFFASQYSFFSW